MTKEDPITHAPDDWDKNGVPYAAYCKCCNCGLVTTSTITFDYFADNPGDPLQCENCKLGRRIPPEAIKLIEEIYSQE